MTADKCLLAHRSSDGLFGFCATSAQVRAGKGLLGEELALPSAMGLSLDAMIHIMRRRKVLAEVFKVGLEDGVRKVQGG